MSQLRSNPFAPAPYCPVEEDFDLPEEVPVHKTAGIGFRFWSVSRMGRFNFQLKSVGLGKEVWERGILQATCVVGDHPEIPVPAKNCDCGYYSFHSCPPEKIFRSAAQAFETESYSFQDLWRHERIFGAMRYAGGVQEHEAGTRAEQVEIIALFLPKSKTRSREVYLQRLYLHRLIAWRYRIPLFRDRDKFMAYLESKGRINSSRISEALVENISPDYSHGYPHFLFYRSRYSPRPSFLLPTLVASIGIATVVALVITLIISGSNVSDELAGFQEDRDTAIEKIVGAERLAYAKTGEYVLSSPELEKDPGVQAAMEKLKSYDSDVSYRLVESGESLYISLKAEARAEDGIISDSTEISEYRGELYKGEPVDNTSGE